jgi:hypothetical protein
MIVHTKKKLLSLLLLVACGGGGGGEVTDGGGSGDGGSHPDAVPPHPCVAAGTCPPGVWINVTPTDIGLALGDFGIQTMVGDPVRPSDFYFTSSETPGVFKSTDYGMSWSKISSHPTSYGCAGDPDPTRDPATPITLWCAAGYGYGMARSTDGGVSWTNHETNNQDAEDFGNDPYAVDVDPYDSRHLLAGFHGYPGLSESTDGGVTWSDVEIPSAAGTSLYPYFIDTGDAGTTRTTWMTHSQWGDDGGLWRTTNGTTWTRVTSLQHGHGNSQIFQAGNGVIYAAGLDGEDGHGIYRSTDYGASWTLVNDGTVQNGVFGTANYVYADYGWANADGQDQTVQRAPRATGTTGTWENYAPDAMLVNGSGHAVTSRNPATGGWVIVIGAWTGGIYRYEELTQ